MQVFREILSKISALMIEVGSGEYVPMMGEGSQVKIKGVSLPATPFLLLPNVTLRLCNVTVILHSS